ncbi:hypothetical protein S83_001212, partial [Arachis hypogaea]
ENNYINQNLQLETSCNNNNNIDNNHHHHHQQPKLENFLSGHSFADHHHDYGANSSGDYLFQNCSQPEHKTYLIDGTLVKPNPIKILLLAKSWQCTNDIITMWFL